MPHGGVDHPAFRGTRWLGSIALLAVLLPLLAIGGIIFAQLWSPMSGFDRVLFCLSVAAVLTSTVISNRMRLTSSWRRTFLTSAPAALSLYPITHDLVMIVSGVVISILFNLFRGDGVR